MNWNYIILLLVFLFPLFYRFLLWRDIFSHRNYTLLNMKEYFVSREGREQLFHFLVFLEMPFFVMSFSLVFDPKMEIFLFPLTFYFLLIENIFVFGRIFRKDISFARWTYRDTLALVFFCGLFFIAFTYLPDNFIYYIVFGSLFLLPVYFLMLSSVFSFLKKKQINASFYRDRENIEKTYLYCLVLVFFPNLLQ